LSRGAGEQGSRGEICTSSFPSAPLPLCPSAFQACEKCGIGLLTVHSLRMLVAFALSTAPGILLFYDASLLMPSIEN